MANSRPVELRVLRISSRYHAGVCAKQLNVAVGYRAIASPKEKEKKWPEACDVRQQKRCVHSGEEDKASCHECSRHREVRVVCEVTVGRPRHSGEAALAVARGSMARRCEVRHGATHKPLEEGWHEAPDKVERGDKRCEGHGGRWVNTEQPKEGWRGGGQEDRA